MEVGPLYPVEPQGKTLPCNKNSLCQKNPKTLFYTEGQRADQDIFLATGTPAAKKQKRIKKSISGSDPEDINPD
ncbi:MAG: hypothetical protein WBC26_01320 [Alphaproteobacteria bacterium]